VLQTQKTSSSDPPRPPSCQLPLFEILAKHSILQTDQRSHAIADSRDRYNFRASLAKETPRRLERVEITPCVQNELRIKTAMGGALSNPERALVLRAPSVLMVAWELIDIG